METVGWVRLKGTFGKKTKNETATSARIRQPSASQVYSMHRSYLKYLINEPSNINLLFGDLSSNLT